MRFSILFLFGFLSISTSLSAYSGEDEENDKTTAAERNEQLCQLSEELGIPLDLYSPYLSLYLTVSDWLGTPYRYGSMSKSGTDCSGFTVNIFREVFDADISRTSRSLFAGSRRIAKEELLPGDMVFFKTRGRSISHVGVYLGNNRFAHSANGTGVKISDLDEEYYQRRYAGGGRMDDIEAPQPLYFQTPQLTASEPVLLPIDLSATMPDFFSPLV